MYCISEDIFGICCVSVVTVYGVAVYGVAAE